MAKATLNTAFSGLSGKIDDWVYRQRGGQTVVSPHAEREDRPSPKQKKRRARFLEAHGYAQRVLSDPLKRAHYQELGRQRNCPPNALLISNFLTPPTIEAVERAGNEVRIAATDAIEVVSVTVTLRDADGAKLESGAATKDHGIWIYPTKAPATAAIEALARNRAGAQATRTR